MTEPSQYFKGRTVQEQMDEVIGYVDVRSAEVATAAIASDVAQVHQDMLDANADATAAAASAAAAAGTLANAVKKTGEASQSIAGDIAVAGNLTGGTVTVPAPVNNTDAASKKYVDDQDATKISINDINSYAVGLTGNQEKTGIVTFKTVDPIKVKSSSDWAGPTATFYLNRPVQHIDTNNRLTTEVYATHDSNGTNNTQIATTAYVDDGNGNYTVAKRAYLNIQVRASDGMCRLILVTPAGTTKVIQDWIA